MSGIETISTTAEAFEASALPCRRGVTLSQPAPADEIPAEAQPLPQTMAQEGHAEKSAAQWAYERVLLYLKNFEKQLDAAHEIALGFAGSDAGVLRIEGIGFFDPDILTFYGRTPDGTRTQLIQHVSQLNLMLQAVAKDSPPDEPPRRFGFRLEEGAGATEQPQDSVTAQDESVSPAANANKGA